MQSSATRVDCITRREAKCDQSVLSGEAWLPSKSRNKQSVVVFRLLQSRLNPDMYRQIRT